MTDRPSLETLVAEALYRSEVERGIDEPDAAPDSPFFMESARAATAAILDGLSSGPLHDRAVEAMAREEIGPAAWDDPAYDKTEWIEDARRDWAAALASVREGT